MKILFATSNPAKLDLYSNELKKRGIEVTTLRDLDIDMDVEETGDNAIDNANIKAMAYYKESGIITFSIDDSLFFEDIPQELQPGVNVRRVDGRRLDDTEMLRYYSKLAQDNGGRVRAKWIKGVSLYNGKDFSTYEYRGEEFYLIGAPSKKVESGYPLNSLTFIPQFSKCLSDLSLEERVEYKSHNNNVLDICDFIENSIKDIYKEN